MPIPEADTRLNMRAKGTEALLRAGLFHSLHPLKDGVIELRKKGNWKPYHTIWSMLFLGWFVSYIDRTATGPLITYMIEHEVAFFAGVDNPHAIGGLVGSLFFAGFMLMQFPGGALGDRFGYRTIIVLSIFWAGIATILTGIAGGLITFIILRVLLGLGEGVFYSNDRSYISFHSPPDKVGLGMGIALTGVSVGLTVATLGVPLLLSWAEPRFGEHAWRVPFFVLGAITLFSAVLITIHLKPKQLPAGLDPQSPAAKAEYRKALPPLFGYSAVFLAVVMGIYLLAARFGVSDVGIAVLLTALCPVLIVFVYRRRKEEIGPLLKNRNLLLMYLFFIPVMWHLWFYGFWAVSIVRDFGGNALVTAALIASFNGLAGIIGFPLGGMISDRAASRPNGRRNVLAVQTGIVAVLTFVFAGYVMAGYSSPVVLSLLLFVSGLFFFALQPVAHALASDHAPEKQRGSMFGMLNLIAEVGAILSPVVSGAIRDASGNWGVPLLLDGALLAAAFLCALAVTSTSRKAAPSIA